MFKKRPLKILECDVLVIGSGPGGAITACFAAEAGKEVCLIEEGPDLQLSSAKSHSLEEMAQKYRNSGITPALGKNSMAYVEACCVGGGSEINAALYHRLPPEMIKRWSLKHQIRDFNEDALLSHFVDCEQNLSVSKLPNNIPLSSQKLEEGAKKLNWNVLEVPRSYKYEKDSENGWNPSRQSMTVTYIPRARSAGCKILSNTKIHKLVLDGKTAKFALASSLDEDRNEIDMKITFNDVFVCGGATQTPFLLRGSGIKKNIGNTLQIHPMLKVVAQFQDFVNDEELEVAVHQVKEFAPNVSFGCSISSPPYLALALLDHGIDVQQKMMDWKHLSVYYVSIIGEGTGKVRKLPFFGDPLVTYQISNNDLSLLAEGIRKLGQLLLKAGAVEIYPAIKGYPSIKCNKDLDIFDKALPLKKTNITTVHIFGSCPMGEDIERCAVNSYGKLHGYKNIYINDSSIFPESPGVNPQGTVMALARRNIINFLETI